MADQETILGPDIHVSGQVRGDGNLTIRGRVDGKIQISQQLTVEQGAIVQADVEVRTLVVAGTLVGTIVASESIKLLASARVVGNLATPRIAMEAGAAYRGRVDMGDMDKAMAAVAARPVVIPKPVARPAVTSAPAPRPAPPRLAIPTKGTVVPTKAVPKMAAPAPKPLPASPPPLPRVAGNTSAPAWTKKKIRRR